MITRYLKIGMLLAGLAMGSFSFAADNPADPYEKFNRVMYNFNQGFDILVLKPLSTLYVKIVPKPLAKGFGNFFNNIDNVPTVINDVLQGNIYQATSDSWRLVINTSVGVLGFFDVASTIGLEPNSQDLGLTLARWGYKNSNYLVIPFLGPSTVRDAFAWPVNYEFFTIYPYIYPVRTRYALYG
jgi:phospholipid-binding lipoprotein MlaA